MSLALFANGSIRSYSGHNPDQTYIGQDWRTTVRADGYTSPPVRSMVARIRHDKRRSHLLSEELIVTVSLEAMES